MNAARLKSFGAALLTTAAVVVVSGCGGGDEPDTERGRALFATNCGVCHALAEAGSTAVRGPDLDASFAAARAAGMDDDTVSGIVSAQIANPRYVRDQNDPTYMPADILEGQDAEDVAEYVGSVAGVPGAAPPQLADTAPGATVFNEAGCASCHVLGSQDGVAQGNIGPNLNSNLPGMSKAMIRESIIKPYAQLAQGYGPVMPDAYGQSLSKQDLDDLVDYLYDETNSAAAGDAPSGS